MNDLNKNIVIVNAILNLRPGAQFSVIGDSLKINDKGFLECVKWNDDNIDEPKAIDVIGQIEIVESNWKNKEYQRQRAPEYPPIGDQLDDLFHAGAFSPEMAAKIQAIKDKYPKG